MSDKIVKAADMVGISDAIMDSIQDLTNDLTELQFSVVSNDRLRPDRRVELVLILSELMDDLTRVWVKTDKRLTRQI